MLALVICCVAQLVTAAPLPNAWQINSGGSTLGYTISLSQSQQTAATNDGFHFTLNGRFVTNFTGNKTMTMAYGLGDRSFRIWWQQNGDGDLLAELEGGQSYTLTTNGTGPALYHTHEIIYNPATQTASYLVDGLVMTNNWPGSTTPFTAGLVYWGSGSAAGRGRMNFHTVSFEVAGFGEVVAYDAGTQNNPLVAPNPLTQAWTSSPSVPPASITVTSISPDSTLLAVLRPLAADQFITNSVRLNGQINPRGSPTAAWFEWGNDTNYGNLTAMQEVGRGLSFSNLSMTLTGLVGGSVYHYRLMATNMFGLVAGTDQSLNTSFFQTPVPGLPGVGGGSVAWGDYDGDGQLDFLLTGYDGSAFISELWRNIGNGFTNIPIPGLPGVSAGSLAWGDYDNDGRLDFLLTGYDGFGGGLSQLWRNTGSGFTNVPIPALPGVGNGSVAWGDYDNDGWLDFLLTGDNGSTGFSQLWRNTGSGFTNVPILGLPGVYFSSVAWGDYDNDGRLDFLLTGYDGSGGLSQLWRNTGVGFTNVPIPGLPGVYFGLVSWGVAWGDYDNDGWLDFLHTGYDGYGGFTQLWRNTGGGFTNVPIPGLPGVYHSWVAWGDYNNDGRLDFLLTGHNGSTGVSQLWGNTGNGFTNVPVGLSGAFYRPVVWGDYDNDGRLDFLLTRADGGAEATEVWGNDVFTTNAPPIAPTGLAATVSDATIALVTLNWNVPADDHTPAAGLNYNVRIGTTPGGSDIVAPHALADGSRVVPRMGNAGSRLTAFFQLSPGRSYYWSVQAVDTSFAGSPFAAEQQFTIAPLLVQPVSLSNGVFQFSFTNQSLMNYEVRATTNLALPINQWEMLGLPTPLGGGRFQFNDSVAPNHPRRFYILREQ